MATIGLDIGRHSVKMVALEKTKEDFKIVDVGFRMVPEQNQAYDPERIDQPLWVMAVKELMRQQGIKPKRVRNLVTGINGVHASVKQITTLDMPEEELRSSMVFEARKHIPMDGTDAVIDYQIFGQNSKEVDKIDIGLVAATKGVLNHHLGLLKECGFKPGIVDVDPIAITNAFSHCKGMDEEGVAVLLDIGAVSTSLVVWGNQEQYFTRDIPIGAHDFVKELVERKDKSYLDAQDLLIHEGVRASSAKTESDSASMISVADRTVYDSLAEDIRRSLRFYAKTTGQSFFHKIFLSGGGAATPGLDEFINEKLNVPVDIFNPFEALPGSDEIEIPNPAQYAVAMGLSLRGGIS